MIGDFEGDFSINRVMKFLFNLYITIKSTSSSSLSTPYCTVCSAQFGRVERVFRKFK